MDIGTISEPDGRILMIYRLLNSELGVGYSEGLGIVSVSGGMKPD